MLFHAVLFNFREDVDAKKREEIFAAARAKLPKIPGVTSLCVGENIEPDGEFRHAITMCLPNRAALDVYRDHPLHVEFRDVDFFPFVAEKQRLDFEEQL